MESGFGVHLREIRHGFDPVERRGIACVLIGVASGGFQIQEPGGHRAAVGRQFGRSVVHGGGGVDDRAVFPSHEGGDVGPVLVVNRAGLGEIGELGGVKGLPGGHLKGVVAPDDHGGSCRQRDAP